MQINSVLVVDDDKVAAETIARHVRRATRASVTVTQLPTHAIQLAKQRCFDIILTDVTIPFQGTPFGGLELYRALVGRYGSDSLIAYSHMITDELLKGYGITFNFIEQQGTTQAFAPSLVAMMKDRRKEQTCFIAMPFEKSYADLHQSISDAVTRAGYRPVRIDRRIFNRSIVDEVFQQIRETKVVIFVATGENANVFFEAGFALALNKEVIVVCDRHSKLPFDIRDRQAIEYRSSLSTLQRRLQHRLESLTSPDHW